MGIFRGIKRFIAPVTDYKTGTDIEQHKKTASSLHSMIQRFFVVDKGRHVEDFDSAMQRLNLSEQDILERKQALLRLSIMMLVITIGVFIYFCYHLGSGHLLGAMVSLVLTLLCAVLTFRHHFWYFQIKQRKLGCTLKEWFMIGLLGRRL